MAINIPGFAYHTALQSRKKLVAVFQTIVDERRALKKDWCCCQSQKDMMDALLEAEQEEIVKNRPVEQKGLTLKEIRKMTYLSQELSLDPEVWPEPLKFDPSRWDNDFVPKVGTFVPFGLGKRVNPKCPVQFLPHRRPTDNCLAR
ncbi:Ent-kaurenoic acid oxidase 1, partial [Bienertia sinuspersici]